MDATVLEITLPRAAIWVKGAVRADRAVAYGLMEPWVLPRLGGDLVRYDLIPPDFVGEAFAIVDGVITELPFAATRENCDGCTLAPDFWPRSFGELRAYIAAIFHDRWYQHLEEMAEAWGWSVMKTRKLGDIIFANILRSMAAGLPFWSRQRAYLMTRLYYGAVRAFGGRAHAAYKRLGACGAASGLVVLGGCAVPTAWEEPGAAIDLPAHSYTNTVTGAAWEMGTARRSAPQDDGASQ